MQAAMVDWCLTANKVRGCRSVDLFIYSWTSMNLFWQFTVKKTSLPLPAERFSYLYIWWFAYMDEICKEYLWIKCVFALKFLICCVEIKGLLTILMIILSQKISSPWKQYTQLSITDIKMLQLTGKIWKAHKVCNFFLLLDWQNFHHFFKLGAWNEAKTCACMLITFFPSEITSNYLKLYQSVHYWASN